MNIETKFTEQDFNFWGVFREGRGLDSEFSCRSGAVNEAVRQAKENPGARFYVAHVQGYAICEAVTFVTLGGKVQ